LGNVNITKDRAVGEAGYGDHVDRGVYLLNMLRRRRGTRTVDAEKVSDTKQVR
jgi:hypothetical protein